MSVEAKTRLLEAVRNKLSDKLTLTMMNDVLIVLNEEINNFELNDIIIGANSCDMLVTYINALNIEGKSEKTLKQYKYILGRFLKKVNVPINKVNINDIRSYFNAEQERGISKRTLETERQYLHAFFGWLHREGLIQKNPASNISHIKYKKTVLAIFSDSDTEKIKNACETIRDKAIVTFLASTGCRIGEVIRLNRDDINFKDLEVKVLGKGNKERVVYLDEISAMFLRQYLDSRNDDNNALFLGKRKERLGDNGIRVMLNRVEKKSGVRHIHPHKFRRTLATNLNKRGMPIEKIAAILGHENINTTMKYIVLDQRDIEHDYRKFA